MKFYSTPHETIYEASNSTFWILGRRFQHRHIARLPEHAREFNPSNPVYGDLHEMFASRRDEIESLIKPSLFTRALGLARAAVRLVNDARQPLKANH